MCHHALCSVQVSASLTDDGFYWFVIHTTSGFQQLKCSHLLEVTIAIPALCNSVFYVAGLSETLIEACQRSMEPPSVYEIRARQTCMGPRICCVAAGACLACYVCSVVRDSRMWCFYDIGRDSWVWGDRRLLRWRIPPTKWGMRHTTRGAPVGRKRGGPWV